MKTSPAAATPDIIVKCLGRGLELTFDLERSHHDVDLAATLCFSIAFAGSHVEYILEITVFRWYFIIKLSANGHIVIHCR